MTDTNNLLGKKVTVRKGANKAHRAWADDKGNLLFACRCPGTNAGYARHGMRIVCEGWETATCKN